MLPTNPKIKRKALAGNICTGGHRQITLFKITYSAHALAWFYMTGTWPRKDIDHKNGIPDDNRWCNLRLATDSQNIANSKLRRDNTSGFKGVSWRKAAQKWEVSIKANRIKHYLGLHATAEAAYDAYCKAALRLHGEFARVA